MKLIIIFLLSVIYINSYSQGAGNAINFDGVNDHIITDNSNFNIPSNNKITIEFWIKCPSFKNETVFSVEGVYFMEITSTGAIRVAFDGGAGNTINTDISNNRWHHITLANNGNITLVYIDGIQIESQYEPIGSISNTNDILSIGSKTDGSSPFIGEIDEFRIWTYFRSEYTTRPSICKTLMGNEYGLELYYNFDGTSGNTIIDSKGSANGTLTNMDASTDRVISSAHMGDESTCEYTSSWSGVELGLNSSSRSDFLINNISGYQEGIHVYKVDALPNNSSKTSPAFGSNNVYYSVFIADPSNTEYDITFDYSGYTDAMDLEDNLIIYMRKNSSSPWFTVQSTTDTAENTIKASGITSGGDISFSSSAGALPIELLSFDAILSENNIVSIQWQTATETNNDFFTIEKSINNTDWEEVQNINGAGTSTSIQNYSINDNSTNSGTIYYRLIQTDFDGTKVISESISINLSSKDNSAKVYPNPVSDKLYINGTDLKLSEINIFNSLGKDITHKTQINIQNSNAGVINLSQLPYGVYIIKINTLTKSIIKTKLKH